MDHMNGLSQYILTLLGLCCFVTPPGAPNTLWFISLLLMLYLLTPFVTFKRKSWRECAIRAGLLIAVVVFLDWVFEFDSRVVLYMPLYFLGAILNDEKDRVVRYASNILSGIISIVLFCCFAALMDWCEKSSTFIYSIAEWGNIISGMVFLLFVGFWVCKIPLLDRLMRILSYASMIAYLFHRLYFGVLHQVFGTINWPVAVFVCLPGLMIIAYYSQLLYDKGISKLNMTRLKHNVS